MSKEDLIKELAKTTVPPQGGWPAPQQTSEEPDELARIRKILGVDGKTDLTQAITELRQAEAQRQKDAIVQRITELVSDEDTGVKVKAMRGMVIELVKAREPQTPDEAEQAYKQVCELESVKTALNGHVRETMGPPQRSPVQGQNSKGGKFFKIPSKEAE